MKSSRKTRQLRPALISKFEGRLRRDLIRLYYRSIKRFPCELELWVEFVLYMIKQNENHHKRSIHELFSNIISRANQYGILWVMMISYYNDHIHDTHVARTLSHNALRFIPNSPLIWKSYFNLELNHLLKLSTRNSTLFSSAIVTVDHAAKPLSNSDNPLRDDKPLSLAEEHDGFWGGGVVLMVFEEVMENVVKMWGFCGVESYVRNGIEIGMDKDMSKCEYVVSFLSDVVDKCENLPDHLVLEMKNRVWNFIENEIGDKRNEHQHDISQSLTMYMNCEHEIMKKRGNQSEFQNALLEKWNSVIDLYPCKSIVESFIQCIQKNPQDFNGISTADIVQQAKFKHGIHNIQVSTHSAVKTTFQEQNGEFVKNLEQKSVMELKESVKMNLNLILIRLNSSGTSSCALNFIKTWKFMTFDSVIEFMMKSSEEQRGILTECDCSVGENSDFSENLSCILVSMWINTALIGKLKEKRQKSERSSGSLLGEDEELEEEQSMSEVVRHGVETLCMEMVRKCDKSEDFRSELVVVLMKMWIGFEFVSCLREECVEEKSIVRKLCGKLLSVLEVVLCERLKHELIGYLIDFETKNDRNEWNLYGRVLCNRLVALYNGQNMDTWMKYYRVECSLKNYTHAQVVYTNAIRTLIDSEHFTQRIALFSLQPTLS